ncbi:MAG: hypothetical protein H6834_09255 [Planctomycetes bacterium]|nr:hypothetical protein [Planctomycetota bacterium]
MRESSLIRHINEGDPRALEALLREELPVVQRYVRKHLKQGLRRQHESEDFVQETMGEFLRYRSRRPMKDRGHVRALLCRMALQRIRDRAAYDGAEKRRVDRACAIPRDTLLGTEITEERVERPSQTLARGERVEWMQIGLDAIDEDDRRLIVWREFEGRSFAWIAERMNLNGDAARMRFQRALARFAHTVRRLRDGHLSDLV